MALIFQMRHFSSSYLKGLQNYDPSKLEVQGNCLMLALLLSKKGFEWVQGQISLGPTTLTGHSFAALDL